MSLFRIHNEKTVDGPHQDQPVKASGTDPSDAAAGIIVMHGRGASAAGILSLAQELDLAKTAYRAPQAKGHSWYPYSFLRPVSENEPGLSSGLQSIHDQIHYFHQFGLKTQQVVLMGFSQGACLALEYAARHPQGYGGLIGFSGGLIGESVEFHNYSGSMEGTPVFLGCSEHDPHIPAERVHETARLFRYLDGQVSENLYPELGHTINEEEIEEARQIIQQVIDTYS